MGHDEHLYTVKHPGDGAARRHRWSCGRAPRQKARKDRMGSRFPARTVRTAGKNVDNCAKAQKDRMRVHFAEERKKTIRVKKEAEMKGRKANIRLDTFAGGALAEKVDEAVMQVVENIQNPNTEAKIKRRISIVIDFAPSKTRQVANTKISVTTKLAPTEAIDTQVLMGVDMRTGELGIQEIGDQIRGQMNLADFDQTKEEPQEAAGGKPLDLRNRGPVPGKDVDPETGEVLMEEQKIVDIGQRAVQ